MPNKYFIMRKGHTIFCSQMSFPHYKILIGHEINYYLQLQRPLSYTSNPKKRTEHI
jgi:hypothetical protein